MSRVILKEQDNQLLDLINLIQCSICQEGLKEPITTTCGHSFCQVCIKRHLAGRKNSGCPLCKNPVNRRGLTTDVARDTISQICSEIPYAFTADAEDIIKHLYENTQEPLESLEVCKMSKPLVKETPHKGNKKAESFVPRVTRSKKVVQYSKKKKNQVDSELVSVSQVESSDGFDFIVQSGRTEKKLKKLKKLQVKEKINQWMAVAGEDMFRGAQSSSLAVDKGTTSSDTDKSTMIRVDYCKTNGEDEECGKPKDPYEYIASQNDKYPKKKKRKSANKYIPDFMAIQSFSKESVKRNEMLQQESPPKSRRLSEILFGEPKKSPAEPITTSSNKTSSPETHPIITASQKFDKLLSEATVPEVVNTHTLYSQSKNDGCSLDCASVAEQSTVNVSTTQKRKRKSRVVNTELFKSPEIQLESSDSEVHVRKRKKTPKAATISRRRTSTRRLVVNAEELAKEVKEIEEYPLRIEFGAREKKRTPLKPLRVSDRNSTLPVKKATANQSKLTELLEEIVKDATLFPDVPSPEVRIDEDSEKVAKDVGAAVKAANQSALGVSSVVSRSPGWSRISGMKDDFRGRRTLTKKALNVSGGELTNLTNLTIKPTASVLEKNTSNGDTELYIEDLSQEGLKGFGTQKAAEDEDCFRKMVDAMDEELLNASAGNITLVRAEDVEADQVEDPKSPIKINEKEREPVPEEEPVKKASESPSVISCSIQQPVLQQQTKQKKVKAVTSRDIPFSLKGKFRRGKNRSVLYLQLGRITPLLRRSHTNLLKLVLVGDKQRNRRSSAGDKPVRSIGVQADVPMVTSVVQTSQTSEQSVSTYVQTAEKTVASAGMQTSLKAFADFAHQTSQRLEKPKEFVSAYVQTSQLRRNSFGVQTSQALPDALEMSCMEEVGLRNVTNDPKNNEWEDCEELGQIASELDKKSSPDVTDFPPQPSLLLEAPVGASQVRRKTCDVQPSPVENDWDMSCIAETENVNPVGPHQHRHKECDERGKEEKSEELIDSQLKNEFDRTWDRSTKKKSGSSLSMSLLTVEQKKSRENDVQVSQYFPGSDSGNEVGRRKFKRIRKLSEDSSEPERAATPEKFADEEEVVNLATPEKLDSQELLRKVMENIDKDLQVRERLRRKVSGSQLLFEDDPERGKKVANSEESDSDMYVEQTPPRRGLNRTSVGAPAEKDMGLGHSDGGDVIADSLPREGNHESFLMVSRTPTAEKFVTPDKAATQFPTKAAFFGSRKEESPAFASASSEEKWKKRSSEAKSAQMKAVLESWKRSESDPPKQRMCIAASQVKNPRLVEEFAMKFKLEYVTTACKALTHLVVGLHENDDEEMLPFCTPKLLFAMANRKWVVTELWVETCMKLNMVLPEEPFESTDPVGGGGCKAARLSTEPLFDACEVFLLGDFKMISRAELAALVSDCGGVLVHKPEQFSHQPSRIRMIVADRDSLQLDEAHLQGLTTRHRTAVLSRDIIISSVQSYKLVNFTPHLLTLTSEEELLGMGYPFALAKHEEDTEWTGCR